MVYVSEELIWLIGGLYVLCGYIAYLIAVYVHKRYLDFAVLFGFLLFWPAFLPSVIAYLGRDNPFKSLADELADQNRKLTNILDCLLEEREQRRVADDLIKEKKENTK